MATHSAKDTPVVDVVAAVIFDDARDQVLLTLRKPEQHQGDRWEFPGGKVEPGEVLEEALCRELKEELDIVPETSFERRSVVHDYPEKTVRLHFRDVYRFLGTPQGLEAQVLRWVPIAELASLPFPDANQIIVDELVAAVI